MSHSRETMVREHATRSQPWYTIVEPRDEREAERAESNRRVGPFEFLSRILAHSSFLLAILLPVVYLPILVTGFPTPTYIPVTAGLILLHIVSLILGHNYLPRATVDSTTE